MELLKIGEAINNERDIELCEHCGYHRLVDRIKSSPERYKEWVFDGASMLPDELVKKILHIPNLIEIAPKHDLRYAYGESGNKEEKLKADQDFEQDLIADSLDPIIAKKFFSAVDKFGVEELDTPFRWTFAHV